MQPPLQFTVCHRDGRPMARVTRYHSFPSGLLLTDLGRHNISLFTSDEKKAEVLLAIGKKIFGVIKLSDDREIIMRHVRSTNGADFPNAVAMLRLTEEAKVIRVQAFPSADFHVCNIEQRPNQFPYLHIPNVWAAMFVHQSQRSTTTPNSRATTPIQSSATDRREQIGNHTGQNSESRTELNAAEGGAWGGHDTVSVCPYKSVKSEPRTESIASEDQSLARSETKWPNQIYSAIAPIPNLLPFPIFPPQVSEVELEPSQPKMVKTASETGMFRLWGSEKSYLMPVPMDAKVAMDAISAGLRVYRGRAYLPAIRINEGVIFAQLYMCFKHDTKEVQYVLAHRPKWIVRVGWINEEFLQWLLDIEKYTTK